MSDIHDFFNIGITAPNFMVICLDETEEAEDSGRLYSCYSTEPAIFKDEYQLLLLMEQVMESINYPQASVELRMYGGKDALKHEKPDKVMEQRELLEFRGAKATYAVRVQYRQNATWQGEIMWLEQNITRSFSSELEMLKLMDNLRDE